MKKQTVNSTLTTPKIETQSVYYSDGSELIPSEVSSNIQNNNLLVSGCTVDDEGILNNYAVEPEVSATTYPNSKQQLRYIFWGAGASLFVAAIVLIAFAVS